MDPRTLIALANASRHKIAEKLDPNGASKRAFELVEVAKKAGGKICRKGHLPAAMIFLRIEQADSEAGDAQAIFTCLRCNKSQQFPTSTTTISSPTLAGDRRRWPEIKTTKPTRDDILDAAMNGRRLW